MSAHGSVFFEVPKGLKFRMLGRIRVHVLFGKKQESQGGWISRPPQHPKKKKTQHPSGSSKQGGPPEPIVRTGGTWGLYISRVTTPGKAVYKAIYKGHITPLLTIVGGLPWRNILTLAFKGTWHRPTDSPPQKWPQNDVENPGWSKKGILTYHGQSTWLIIPKK